jgi:hypothetical protein
MPNYALLKKSMPNAQSQGGNFDEDKKEPGSRKKRRRRKNQAIWAEYMYLACLMEKNSVRIIPTRTSCGW